MLLRKVSAEKVYLKEVEIDKCKCKKSEREGEDFEGFHDGL